MQNREVGGGGPSALGRRVRGAGPNSCAPKGNGLLAFEALVRNVSDDELERLSAELERIAFGDDIAARDAAKREAFAAAGCPDWNPPTRELREDG